MVGSALMRQLSKRSHLRFITRTRAQLELTNQADVFQFFEDNDIDEVYLAAARVGGIHANKTYPVEFLYENLSVQNNVIEAAHRSGVPKLLFLGSSCIYPRLSEHLFGY